MKYWIIAFFALLLAGCEAQATPIAAVAQSTNTPEAIVTLPPPIRYGLMPNTQGYLDSEQLRQNALVELVSADAELSSYDIVAGYGIVEGWSQSPIVHHALLIINEKLSPLNEASIRTVLRRSINTQALSNTANLVGLQPAINETIPIASLRTELANLGYPDGFRLTLAHEPLPGLESILMQLESIGLQLDVFGITKDERLSILNDKRAHLLLAIWGSDSEYQSIIEQIDELNLVELYQLPISYRAADDLTITFTARGWPIATR